MDYRKDMSIDDAALDIEWLEQPQLAFDYGLHWSECKMKMMQAEENIKVVRAELVKKANDNPDRFLGAGIKPTAPNIEAYYRNHKLHKQAKKEWIDATFECNVAEIAKNEVSFSRKAALENMVELYLGSYFAGPKMPRDLILERRNRNETRKNANKRVRLNK
jgi:hypothetical protein